jgi:hypothetical protein
MKKEKKKKKKETVGHFKKQSAHPFCRGKFVLDNMPFRYTQKIMPMLLMS